MKISNLQLFWLLFCFETGNTILITISPAIFRAKHDAWISFILASVLGIMIVFVAAKAGLLYSDHTLIEFSQKIFGKWLGKAIVLCYIIQWYLVLPNIMGEFVEFTKIILLESTPPWVLIITMVLLIIYGCYIGGIEGISRCSEVFGPIIFLSILCMLVLSISNMDVNRIMPILSDKDFGAIFHGGLTPLSFFGESVVVLMLISFMAEPKKGPKIAVIALVISSMLVTFMALAVLFIFGGQVAGNLRFPAFDAASVISLMDFIQNLEILAVLIWIISVFIKLSVYVFVASYGTAKFFKMKDWRKIIWVVGGTTTFLSILDAQYAYFGANFLHRFWIPYVMPINMIGLPLLMLVIGSIRKKKNSNKSVST